MEYNIFYNLARGLMNRYGLNNWKLELDNAKRRFGLCSYINKTLSFSWPLVKLNTEDTVKDTILHEIAHALCQPGTGHNITWKNKAVSIGCNGNRCYTNNEVVLPKSKYTATCPKCGAVNQYNRLKNVSCGVCTNHYSPEHRLIFVKN